MSPFNRTLQIAVLSMFFIMVSGFVAFKAGLISLPEKELLHNDDRVELTIVVRDSLQQIVDSLERIQFRASSSKSAAPVFSIAGNAERLLLDSLKSILDTAYVGLSKEERIRLINPESVVKTDSIVPIDSFTIQKMHMSTSKSIFIFKPDTDTVKAEQKK